MTWHVLSIGSTFYFFQRSELKCLMLYILYPLKCIPGPYDDKMDRNRKHNFQRRTPVIYHMTMYFKHSNLEIKIEYADIPFSSIFFIEKGRILSSCPSRFRFRTSPYCLMVVLLPSWGKNKCRALCCRQYVRLQLLWYLGYHCVVVMELRVVNTYWVTLCNWVPLITVTLAVGFLVWYFLKSACPLDGTGDSGQSPRAFWTWSHALWLKVGNSVISLRICVCLWHPWYKVRWIMCNERCGYYFHDISNIYRYFWCWNISTRDHDGSKSPSTYCHDD